MKKINVAFFWHMHQPYYLDPVQNQFILPWVRLHATKGYFDMLSVLEDFPKIKQTFNMVPSLLKQIEAYSNSDVSDKYLDLSLKDSKDLDKDEKIFVINNFFHANWDTMIKPYPRYWELLSKKRFFVGGENVLKNYFSEEDMRDLQVWFNLTWFGYSARNKYPFLKEMIKKGSGFTEEEKQQVLNIQKEVLQSIIPLYRKLCQSGQIELTCSPFYHPILPLVYDSDIAKRSMPGAPLPDRFNYPADAKAQISKGIEYFKKVFGYKPVGMWPSEGSVCPELIPFFEECGIKWVATDEEVLMHSINFKDKGHDLFTPYQAHHAGSKVNMIFRDRGLSDLIGFTYSKNRPEDAVANFMSHLTNIANHSPMPDGETLVSVILDGENAWEYYPDGGEEFFKQFYTALSNSETVSTVRVRDFLEEKPPTKKIDKLHSGSWINHDYGIWIGGKEENRGWNMLKKVRDFFDTYVDRDTTLTKEQVERAREELFMAEGSDWFWWYGDIFSSDNDKDFDYLFRTHLRNVYIELGCEVPSFLEVSVIADEGDKKEKYHEPIGMITPVLDGQRTHFYEWQEAGYYELKAAGGSMHQADNNISMLYYGFDIDNFYLRVDFLNNSVFTEEDLSFEVLFKLNGKSFKIAISFNDFQKYKLFKKEEDDKDFVFIKDVDSLAIDDIIEIAVPFSDLGGIAGDKIRYFISLKRKNLELERVPKNKEISFDIPDEHFNMMMWSV